MRQATRPYSALATMPGAGLTMTVTATIGLHEKSSTAVPTSDSTPVMAETKSVNSWYAR